VLLVINFLKDDLQILFEKIIKLFIEEKISFVVEDIEKFQKLNEKVKK
jgi:hypothetical protein